MNTTIYYFSGTGNSLQVAKDLAGLLGEGEVTPIVKAVQQPDLAPKSEAVGFVFPMYFSGLPEIVRRFVQQVNLDNVQYIFAIVTLGGSPGRPVYDLEALLKARSKTLNAAFKLLMPPNYVPMYDMPPEAKQQEILAQARRKLTDIAQIIKERRTRIEQDTVVVRNLVGLLYNPWIKTVHVKDKKFTADEKCTSCNVCEKVCPVSNITMTEGKPQWQHRCQQCLACIHFCPAKAIQFGAKTANRRRYHHPEVTFKDIMVQKG